MAHNSLNFSNTEVAFKSKTNSDLRNSYLLFKAIGLNWLVKIGPALINFTFLFYLPVKGLIKATVFKQFCGGESIEECEKTISNLHEYGIGTILDYSVEGKEKELDFERTKNEILTTIIKAKNNPKIPFCVFKVTGLARFDLLNKINEGKILSDDENAEYLKVRSRIESICKAAYESNVRIFIDAEESWIQNCVDDLADEMMQKFNKELAIVFNTIQLYRHDRLNFLYENYEKATQNSYFLGLKIVRGAYMEKERERAKNLNYTDPIHKNKNNCDIDFNKALNFCIKHIDKISFCCGTHNEESSSMLVKLIQENNIENSDKRIYFSQLFGMSDNLSYNLSNAGFNVAKYLPYGPVKSVLPYLFRRAAENTSVKGQASRELSLIVNELERRSKA